MEELQPVIVDAVVPRCLPTGILRFEEFETTPDKGCPMNARAQQASHKERQGFWIVT
jgi:CRISPR/Cas system-associated endonuclease Cas1